MKNCWRRRLFFFSKAETEMFLREEEGKREMKGEGNEGR